MHTPPPKAAMNALAQKLRPPPSVPPNVQHCMSPDSVQSVFVEQSRTVCVPLHVVPRDVLHALLAEHAVEMLPVVQLGTVPPVMGIVPQHTSFVGQSEGKLQGPASGFGFELESGSSPLVSAAASGPPSPDPVELEQARQKTGAIASHTRRMAPPNTAKPNGQRMTV